MEKLRRVVVNKDGELETSRPPNNEEIVAKVNEIVEWINLNQQVIRRLKGENMIKNPFKN